MVKRVEMLDDVIKSVKEINVKSEYRIMYERIIAEYGILKGYLTTDEETV